MATRQTMPKQAMVEARWIIKILLGIIGGLCLVFIIMGWISQSNETERMKACVSKSNREWTNGGCVFPGPQKLTNGHAG